MWHRDYYAPCLYSHTQVDASMHILLSVANTYLLFIDPAQMLHALGKAVTS